MATEHGQGKNRGATVLTLEERVSYLEHMKLFQDEMVKIIRIYTSSESFTSERCLQEMINFISRKFSIHLVTVLLVDDLSRELILYVSSGDDALSPLVKNYRVPIGQGLTGACAKEGESLVVNDVPKDPRYLPGPFKKTLSELCVPIKIKHRIAGVLDLQDNVRNRFKKDFVRLMEDIALNIGFVVETNQLYDNLKQHNEQLERKVSEKINELVKSEERYRAILENATDPIFTLDTDGHFTWLNRATCLQLGCAPEDLVGTNITRLVKKGHVHKLYGSLREALEGRAVKPVQIEILLQNGEERTVDFSCTSVRDNGDVSGVEGALRDITDRVVVDKLKKNYMKKLEEAVVERTTEIKETQRATILAISNLAESIDDDTGGHLERIRHYCRIIAEDMRNHSPYKDEISEEYVEMIYDLSPLHDLGKVGIRDYILQKPDKLTDEEFEKMKDHAEIGARALRMAGEMIKRESIFTVGEMIARYHHEKWDGSGYPAVDINGQHRALKGAEIPLCARIVALSDVYDALTSKRPYKMPFPHDRAREMIVSQGGRHFDPEVVQSFLRVEQKFIEVRTQFPDTHIPEGRPFELPARDQA